MTNIMMNNLDEYRDVEVFGKYNDLVKTGLLSHEEFMLGAYKEARDNNRIPFQWDSSKNAGFTSGETTWIKVHPNYQEINAENEIKDSNSIFNYYKQLLNLRKNSEYSNALVYGKFESYLNEHPDVFVYSRSDDEVKVGVISNMKNYPVEVELPFEMDKILLQNYDKRYNSNKLLLEPYETIVGKIK